jgi:hypothetical protein
MDLTLAIATLPLWLSAFLLVVLPTLVTMCGPAVVRHFVGLERITVNNEVAGFKFATLGVIYAVLLGFAVIVVWERFSEAEGVVTREAGAVASMFRLSTGFDSNTEASFRGRLSEYTKSVIVDDWPEMWRGRESLRTRKALNDLYRTVLSYSTNNPRDAVVIGEFLNQLDHVTQERRQRLELAAGIVPGLIWLVLLLGAMITLSFTFFFGLENLRAQIAMTGMLALLIYLALFVAASIDHPFTGPIRVTPESLNLVLEDL